MSLINSGFDGTVTERDFSRIMRGVGVRDSVETAAAWNVTQGTGRQVSVAPGVAYAAGVVSDSGVAILAALPTPVNGQWHLVVRRINWASNTVTVATIPHTTTTTTIPTTTPAGFPAFNDNTGVLVDQHLAWAWVRSTDTAVAVFDLRNVQGVQRTSVVVADFTALALLPVGVRFVGEQAFVVEGAVYMSWTGTVWRQVTTATFATTGARDTAYAKAGAAYRVAGVRALDTSTSYESQRSASNWFSNAPAYAQAIANQNGLTGEADLTGLSVTLVVGAGRRIQVSASVNIFVSTIGTHGNLRIRQGANQLMSRISRPGETNLQIGLVASTILTPAAGTYTYRLSLQPGGGGTVSNLASPESPSFILAEDIGPA